MIFTSTNSNNYKMKTKFSGILTLLLAFVVQLTFAQEKTISGTVSDGSGLPLPGATVLVKGTSSGTSSDFDGNYLIKANQGATLVFSFVGYSTSEAIVGASNTINVTLQEDSESLEEVVVTAFSNTGRNARAVVYANQTVKADDLLSTPSKNALEALRGKAAGVRLSTGSGSVGASTRIVLRGEGSLTGDNNALIIVDGVAIDNSSTAGGAGTSTTGYADYGNRFNDINPDDIESVTILKGPSATSLYGSRGASGVVLVTTKSGGSSGSKMKIDFNSSSSVENAIIVLDRQNRFGQGYDNLHLDSGENWSWGPSFDGVVRPWTSPIDSDGDGALESLTRPYSAVPDQLENFFNSGYSFNNSLSFSGSNGDYSYYASYANTDQTGILENTFYKRNNFTFSSTAKLSDRLKTDFKFSYANTVQNTNQEGSRAFEGNNAYAMTIQSPVNIPFNELRDYKSPFHDVNGYWGSYSSVNPYFILNEYGNEAEINNFLANTSLSYQLLDDLTLTGRFGGNIVTTQVDTWTPSYSPNQQLVWTDNFEITTRGGRHESLGEYVNFNNKVTNVDVTLLANYSKDLSEDFTLTATGGYNFFQRKQSQLTGNTVGGLVVDGVYNLSNSVQNPTSSMFESKYRIYGALGNASLGYKNAAFLEISARNDWSSTLPAESNSFLYGAIGGSVIFTDLFNIKNDVINYGKVRGSYGTSGKDAGIYLLNSYFVGNPEIVGLGDFSLTFPKDGVPGFTVGNRIGNPSLKPELTTTYELGADLGLLNDKISLSYTYYKSSHADQIVTINLPRSSGYTQTVSNIGEMENIGHELTLALRPLKGIVDNLDFEIFGTYSKNDNKVIKITDDITELTVGGPYTPGVSIVAKEGLPFGTYKALAPQTNAAGQVIVDGNTGFPLYTDEEVYLGSYQPDYLMSFGANANYKGIGFKILFDKKSGGNFVSQTQFFTEFNGTAAHTAQYNRETYVIPNSVIDNNDGTFSENTIGVTEQDYFTNYDPAPSNYLVDASYVKLRELEISYTVPSNLLKNTVFSRIKFALFGKNLKFWLPDGNIFADPEVNGPSLTGNAQGIETTQTPSSRSMGLNLQLSF